MTDDKHQLGVGHRLKSRPSEAMGAAMNSELSYASFVAEGLSRADLAHCLMLAEAKILSADKALPLLAALLELDELGSEAWSGSLTEGDIYDHRDAWLKKHLGEPSGWLHTGRARREAINLGWLLGLQHDALELKAALLDLAGALYEVSESHSATLMPDFTYLQHAHPTTLGHYLLGFVYPFLRDLDRLESEMKNLDACPAGSVSTNGTRLPINRERMRDLLGFATLIEHNRDAMWQPDLAIACMGMVTSVQTTLDRMAEEIFLWCTHEFGFVELSDAHCRTSVIMPQKKNPYALAHIRGRARAVPGQFQTVVLTNLTVTGQVDNRTAAYQLVPQAMRDAVKSLRLMAEILRTASFKEGRMAEAAGQGFPWATELVEWLVESEQMDARTAHSLAGSLVAELSEADGPESCAAAFRRNFEKMRGQPWMGVASALSGVFDVRGIAVRRETHGSCGAEPMKKMLSSLKSQLESGKASLREASHKRATLRQRLFAEVAKFMRKSSGTSHE